MLLRTSQVSLESSVKNEGNVSSLKSLDVWQKPKHSKAFFIYCYPLSLWRHNHYPLNTCGRSVMKRHHYPTIPCGRSVMKRHHYPTIPCGPCLSKSRFYLVYKLYILTVSTFCIYTRNLQWWPPRAFAQPCGGNNWGVHLFRTKIAILVSG